VTREGVGTAAQAAPAGACPVCAGAAPELYVAGEERRLSPTALGSSRTDLSPGRVLRCRVCGLGYRQTRPDEEQLARLYRALDGEVYEADGRGRAQTAARHLRIVRRERTTGRLLDVGCASGAFLRCAADAGWRVVGVEPAAALAARARTLLAGRGEVLGVSLQEACLPAASFDAVTLWDVLEHVPDPVDFLRTGAALLKPGGHLYANVPDLESLQARVLRTRWPLLLPEHLTYFSRRSLERCGERAALTWVRSGRRPASFSLQYLLYRLAQHGVPGAAAGRRLVVRLGAGGLVLPVPLGERYVVWRREGRSPAAGPAGPGGAAATE
jgi:SAM-dependent methyltransferase